MRTQKSSPVAILIFFFTLLFAVSLSGYAQVKTFKKNQRVNIGAGKQLKILNCKGEGEKKECEVAYFVNNKQVGNSFWLTANAIQKKEKNGAPTSLKRKAITKSKEVKKISTATDVARNKLTSKRDDKKRNNGDTFPAIKTGIPQAIDYTANKTSDRTAAIYEEAIQLKIKNALLVKKQGVNGSPLVREVKPHIEKEKIVEQARFIPPPVVKKEEQPGTASDNNFQQAKKLRVFIDCNANCDMSYLKSELTILDFSLDMTVADVHVLINQQTTGGGGKSIQMIFYGLEKFHGYFDTLTLNTSATSTAFEQRDEILKGLKMGLVPFLAKTSYSKYLDIKMNLSEQEALKQITATNDPWNYWVFKIGTDGSFDYGDVYKTTDISSYVNIERTTDKLKVILSAYENYNKYKYSYVSSGSSIDGQILNRHFFFQHSLVSSLGPHWGFGYQTSFMKSTFSNIKSQIKGKALIEYSVFPYKDVNTRSIAVSYGVDVRRNEYYDSTVYLLTEEVLAGQALRIAMSFTQKWGTFNSTISYSSYFKDAGLNSLSASLSFNIRISGGLSFNVYTYGSRVQDQIYLPNGSVSIQDVLTRGRILASKYNFNSGVGLNFRFGSKLNNFVNPRLENL